MTATFVHLSDIHFGQERDERVHIHDDVKRELILDAGRIVRELPGGTAQGILVTGDIAHSGKAEQYAEAGKWLDNLAAAIGCEIFRIQMVPGNHDVDRDKQSVSSSHILDILKEGNPTKYEGILSNETDRASLFARFEAYGRFGEAYDCPLDEEGKYATNMQVELAPGRTIRFVRLNSALLCTGTETEENQELMMGARQFTIPRSEGEETIVLIHHPLNWFKDGNDARDYLRSRARVIMSGHEHNPKVLIDEVDVGCSILMVAAGATVPFRSSDAYKFTYNVIEFSVDEKQDALAVTIHPRAWNPRRTCFEHDGKPLNGLNSRIVLASPNYRNCRKKTDESGLEAESVSKPSDIDTFVEIVAVPNNEEEPAVSPEIEGYRLVLLRFFRDLTEEKRLRILVELHAIPEDSNERITQGVQRRLLDWLVGQGKIEEVKKMIDEFLTQTGNGKTK